MKMDTALLMKVVPNELCAQTSQGTLEAYRRGFRVYDNHFANGKTLLEKEIKRKGDDLWLATKCCQQDVRMFWQDCTPI